MLIPPPYQTIDNFKLKAIFLQIIPLTKIKKYIGIFLGSFGAQVFGYLLLAMILLHASFDFFLVNSQQQLVAELMEKEGKTITSLLADNVKLAVFSENIDKLSHPVQSVLDLKEVTGVLIIDPAGNQLIKKSKDYLSLDKQCLPGLRIFKQTSVGEKPLQEWATSEDEAACMIIGSPILISRDRHEEQLYFTTDSSSEQLATRGPSNTLVGYVAVVFDKQSIQKSQHRVFSDYLTLFIVFLVMAALVTFLIVRIAIRPLSSLVATVKKSGIQIEATNQIGMLDKSFSALVGQLAESIRTIKNLHSDLEELTRELLRTQEEERQKLALDLHDDVAQDLSSLRMTCDTMLDEVQEPPESLVLKKNAISVLLKKCIQTVRSLSHELQPPDLKSLGLSSATQNLCISFANTNNLKIDFIASGFETKEPDYQIAINCYRIIQEALNNIRKHAKATHVEIKMLASFPSLIIRINDNGIGFDVEEKTAQALANKRMGLQNIKKRVHLLNGQMKIKSAAGQGTKILIELPFIEKNYESKNNHIDS